MKRLVLLGFILMSIVTACEADGSVGPITTPAPAPVPQVIVIQ